MANLTALQILQQFNVVDYTNFSTTSDVEGTIVVGGNVTGNNSQVYTSPSGTGNQAPPTPPPGFDFPALTVYGTLETGYQVNNGGNAYVAHDTGSLIFNGGGGHGAGGLVSQPSESISQLETTLNALNTQLSGLTANSTINASDNNNVDFIASPNASNVAVFSVSASALDSYAGITLTGATSADTIIIDVTGSGNFDPSFNMNGEFRTLAGHNIIWNFGTNVTNIALQRDWYGAIVAPTATVSDSSDIDGFVAAHSIDVTAEIHQWTYDGIIPCFARGTRIATPAGEMAVETLKAGDCVHTRDGDGLAARPVKWIGWRRIDLAAHPRPELAAPIRIQRGAFPDNMPHRDLLVSPDHAIFVDGVLICARQLVNGTTISQVTGLADVTYFHVELDEHSVLLAEGLAAESYLDTGNRGIFVNSDEPTVLHPDMTDEAGYPTRENASCAPFVFDDAGVRPVWERLAARAAALGQPVPAVETVTDPGVRVIADGRTIRPIRLAAADGFRFVLPKGATEVRLLSNATSPTVVTPWQEDRRSLGLYVERIVLHSGVHVSEIPVDHPSLTEGWWAVEGAGRSLRRWTDGAAVLPLPDTGLPVILEIRAATNGVSYLAAGEPTRAIAAETQRIAA
jgi:choice-of-anchor A domain-containing protein